MTGKLFVWRDWKKYEMSVYNTTALYCLKNSLVNTLQIFDASCLYDTLRVDGDRSGWNNQLLVYVLVLHEHLQQILTAFIRD